jgi:hypothetical protein
MRRRDRQTASTRALDGERHQRRGAVQLRGPIGGARLTIDLVPETCWVSDIREIIPPSAWEQLRRRVEAEARHRCEVCGQEPGEATECHEVWEYDEAQHTQRLERMVALCDRCHQVAHIDRAGEPAAAHAALEHLAVVNGCGVDEAQRHRATAFRRWRERSRHGWSLDLEALRKYGFDPDLLVHPR